MKLSQYILLPREERIAHIDLGVECKLGTLGRRQRGGLIPLFTLLGVEDDISSWVSSRIHVCHLCSCGRRRGQCGEVKHIYIGTARENQYDLPPQFRQNRHTAMQAAREKKPWHKAFDIFLQDIKVDSDLLLLPSRKLADMYGVSHAAIQRWKKLQS